MNKEFCRGVPGMKGVELNETEVSGVLRADGGGLDMKKCSLTECVSKIRYRRGVYVSREKGRFLNMNMSRIRVLMRVL